MRENRLYGSEGGESQLNAISLPLSIESRSARNAQCDLPPREKGNCDLPQSGI